MGAGDASVTAENNKEVDEGVGGGSDGVTVNVRFSNGSKFSVQASLGSSVASFKSVLAQKCELPAERQRLIYKGRILKDDQTLQSYGLDAGHTVHLIRGFTPGSVASTTTTGGNTQAVNTNSAMPGDSASTVGGTLGGSGLGASLFPGLGLNGLGSDGGLFGAGSPELEQMQQHFADNPNIFGDTMNMPLVENLMNNPDIMQTLIMNNPQMREIMDQNPELAHALNDPATLRQSMEAARNPELMREMMRNTDRAMSNIEASPEGFNMLRRMYETVQEPLYNATTMSGDNSDGLGSNPFAALLGSQGGAAGGNQPNNQTSTTTETTGSSPAPNTNPLPNPWASAGSGAAAMNTTTRSSPAVDARTLPLGYGGIGLPDLERMLGTSSTPDLSSMNQLMQNPDMSEVMQSLLSNPQHINQILGLDPQVHGIMDSNPQLREMLQNPDVMRQLTSPETMQQLMGLQQSFRFPFGLRQTTQESGQNAGGAAPGIPDNAGLEMLTNMFGALGTGGLGFPNRPNVPPEEQYANQLTQLQEMGFFDAQENLRALIATNGNMHAAVECLLGNSGL